MNFLANLIYDFHGIFPDSSLSHVLLTAAGLLCKDLAHYMLFPVCFLHNVLVHNKPLLKKRW